ncbi:MAG: anaerobic ribonucleoside-triphosphate reductase activating protein [Deltaproteobacteria bacterium]|nr:anaerobic ribonucleoside-triphosphate reductase activating protein [Deltaproteobacteria bacterium]
MQGDKELKVGGLVPLTTTDLPGHLSAVIFCQGCPWRCRYCHNVHLIDPKREGAYSWCEVISFLERRRSLLDSVVFSGGEPTMQKALPDAAFQVKVRGFKVGLHTAGQFPDTLQRVLPFVDWVGMDLKAPTGKYKEIIGRRAKENLIRKSIELIVECSHLSYEFRTTFHSELLSEGELLDIARMLSLSGAKHFALQYFRKTGCDDIELLQYESILPSQSSLAEIASLFDTFEIRGAV